MGKYKALIVNGKGVIKTVGIILLSSLVTVSAFHMTEKRFSGTAEKILNENLSQTMAAPYDISGYVKGFGINVIETVLGYIPTETESVLRGTIPVYGNVAKKIYPLPDDRYSNIDAEPFEDKYEVKYKKKEKEEVSIPIENQAPIKAIDSRQVLADGMMVAIGNETSYGIDINSILNDKPKIDMGIMGPKVLITHTHATESYARDGAEVYDVTEGDRSEDVTQNVVAVGNKLYEILNSYGIDTLHDKILHDKPSFNGSYAHSLNTVTEYMEKYPTIQIVFDIHRDSIVYDDKTKARTVSVIDGKPAAQLMFVVGTDEKGLYNPDWRDNLTAAIHFQREIAGKYPSLMRRINLRKERFNGHTSKASMIIEVGTSGNSLNEAIYGIELFGECIADYLKRM